MNGRKNVAFGLNGMCCEVMGWIAVQDNKIR